ncbi:MAG: hypothetical protein AAB531_00305 [Patescibacteria group bacterium]
MDFWRNKKYLSLIFILAVALFIFWDLPKTFYQQDEWQTLGHNLAQDIGIFANISPLHLLFGELRPLSGLMYLIFLGFYKFTVVPTAIFGILFHIINATLTFYLVDKITKKRLIAFIASVFLIANSVSHQAVTWASAIGTLPAATLILIAIIMYLKYLEKADKKYLVVSFLSTILSLYFKGIGLSLFILLPLMAFIYKNKPINKKTVKDAFIVNLPLFIFGILIILVRFGEVFLRTEKVAGFVQGGQNFTQSVLLHFILYPLTSLFQVFVPPLDLYSITPAIAKIQYKFLIGSPLTDLVAQSIIADMVAILGSVTILGFLGFMAYKYKSKMINRNILFALLFFFLSFLPYVVLDRDSSYFSGRYFYVSVIPAGILFGYIIYFFANINTYAKWATLFFVTLFLFHHASFIRKDISYNVNLGNERKALLYGISDIYPKLEKDSIFYVTSNKEYNAPITNPFQNGLGYILEVWYYDSGNIPKSFLSENFLWDWGTEGYKRRDDKGFGYFQDIDKMAKEMAKNKLSRSIVHGFFLDSNSKKVINISDEVKLRLATISAIPK